MQLSDLDLTKTYTYADYYSWDFEERVELINGIVFPMDESPGTLHQRVLGNLFFHVAAFLRGREAEVYIGPFDVRLSKYFKEDVEIATVIQPDLTIVCNADILDERGCIAIPDIIAEVLAPRKAVVEFKNKYDAYEESGVKEYWIVDPSHQTVQVNILVDGKYVPGRILSEGDIVTTDILPGFSLNIEKLFAE